MADLATRLQRGATALRECYPSEFPIEAQMLDDAAAIVAKLPKTADGVPVVPGKDEVWLPGNPPTCCMVYSNTPGAGEWVHTSNTQHSYSTREAAAAAKAKH